MSEQGHHPTRTRTKGQPLDDDADVWTPMDIFFHPCGDLCTDLVMVLEKVLVTLGRWGQRPANWCEGHNDLDLGVDVNIYPPK